MTEDLRRSPQYSPIDGAPTWLRALQAALIGVIAGLALHALLSFVVLHGDAPAPKPPGPSQCRKSSPTREAGVPPAAPRISSVSRGAAPAS